MGHVQRIVDKYKAEGKVIEQWMIDLLELVKNKTISEDEALLIILNRKRSKR